MVEFGLIALLFVLILFGIVDFGMLLNGWMNVSTASGLAARQAAVGQSVSNVYTFVTSNSFAPIPGVSPSSLKVAVTYGSPPTSTSYCNQSTLTHGSWSDLGITCAGAPPSTTPNTGDVIGVTVVADQFEIVTPLVRPFFGCSPAATHCYVSLNSSTSMRYEGAPL
jgi:Flp pilus assembly protein TadG